MPEHRPLRLAVLIDADNMPASIVDGLFEEIAKLGEANVRRVYGDFSSPHLKPWSAVLARHGMLAVQQSAHTKEKNASDIGLVIDAMDMLHAGRLDGFCLVSSDSDFTQLAARLRESGYEVFGFGRKNTPESFRQACKRFIYTENLGPAPAAAGRGGAATTISGGKAKVPPDVAKMIARVIDEIDGDGAWIGLGAVGQQLSALAPDFDSRTYGYGKLSDLVRAIEALEVRSEGGHLRVRLAPPPAKAQAAQKSSAAKRKG